MILEEAIKNEEEAAEIQEKLCKTNDPFNFSQLKWKECADEHRQLAEWLKELKQYREWLESFNPDSATDCFTAVRQLRSVVRL